MTTPRGTLHAVSPNENVLDEILNMSPEPEDTAVSPDDSQGLLDRVRDVEEVEGTTEDAPVDTTVGQTERGAGGLGLTRSELAGQTAGMGASMLMPPGPWRGREIGRASCRERV